MSNYIEKDTEDCIAHDDSSFDISSSKELQMEKENIERWKWLIESWDDMNFLERIQIFQPYIEFINPRDVHKFDMGDAITAHITEGTYKICRMFKELKFDPDGRGVPDILIIYDPIDISAIPDSMTRNKVKLWGMKYGFIKCGCDHSCLSCSSDVDCTK